MILPTRWRRTMVAFGALAAMAVLLLVPIPKVWESNWRYKALDLGHVPLFAAFTVVIGMGIPVRWFWSMLGGVVLAAIVELVQQRFGRTGNVPDFIRSVCGAGLGAVALHASRREWTRRRVVMWSALAVAFLAWPLYDATPTLLDAVAAYRAFPVLCDFRSPLQSVRWETRFLRYRRVPDPYLRKRWVGRFELEPTVHHSAQAILISPVADWTGYRWLCFEFDFAGKPPTLLLNTFDKRRRLPYWLTVPPIPGPGRRIVRVRLSQFRAGNRPETLLTTNIEKIVIAVLAPPEGGSFDIVRVWLE